jgi:hypothetical protein
MQPQNQTFSQGKLTKSEWNNMEIPVTPDELTIIKLIKDSYHDVQKKYNKNVSMIGVLKTSSYEEMHSHLYKKYFEEIVNEMIKKYKIPTVSSVSVSSVSVCHSATTTDTIKSKHVKQGQGQGSIKKIDAIRIKNNEDGINIKTVYEFTILKICKLLLDKKAMWNKYKQETQDKTAVSSKSDNNSRSNSSSDSDSDDDDEDNGNDIVSCSWMSYYYALNVNLKNNIEHVNMHVVAFVKHLLELYEDDLDVFHFIKYSECYLEKNHLCTRYQDVGLYEHQKQIFTYCKLLNPKLILYIAPTGTGKTLTPIGLSEKHKIIFVCAARHVGLALAKSAISIQKRIAFAFGCRSVDDIRLHYFAVKEATRDWKTGGIRKVDNSVGDNVEIIISDIQSYLHAMFYMKAFNKAEDIILFWDEPTITMDNQTHEYHELIHKNWKQNIIPNVILSSATLPHERELQTTIADFKTRFTNGEVFNIVSHDCCKSIPIVNKGGCVQLPHTLFSEYSDALISVSHCEKNKTLLRYFGINKISEFISYVNKNELYSNSRYSISRYFSSFNDITLISIKIYYLILLKNIKHELAVWKQIYEYFHSGEGADNLYESTGYVTTSDAHTLTDGPTIFLTNDVEKIASFCLQTAQIPAQLIDDIMGTIQHNNKLCEQIECVEKRIEDLLNDAEKKTAGAAAGAGGDGGGSKKTEKKSTKFFDKKMDAGEIRELNNKLQTLNEQVKRAALNDLFVPNRPAHLKRWHDDATANGIGSQSQNNKPWSCDIEDTYVEKIMLLSIEPHWKILLLMGIGAITDHKNAKYNEIIKELAQDQKLFLIIASSDYIYGTNYQFCHGYISRDLSDMTQEKTIQAMGRVGRNSIQQDYTIRFRDDDLIKKLFLPSTNKLEADNMNKLFSSA